MKYYSYKYHMSNAYKIIKYLRLTSNLHIHEHLLNVKYMAVWKHLDSSNMLIQPGDRPRNVTYIVAFTTDALYGYS